MEDKNEKKKVEIVRGNKFFPIAFTAESLERNSLNRYENGSLRSVASVLSLYRHENLSVIDVSTYGEADKLPSRIKFLMPSHRESWAERLFDYQTEQTKFFFREDKIFEMKHSAELLNELCFIRFHFARTLNCQPAVVLNDSFSKSIRLTPEATHKR